jgi:tetratricopeptide (TPR) repeat protein
VPLDLATARHHQNGDHARTAEPIARAIATQDLFQVAFRHHQAGELRQAAQAYQAILAQNPNHAEALHLLGLVAHQLGQHRQATELIGRAITLRPDVPTYHANLGEVWRALGEFDRAAAACRASLRLRPDNPEAVNNLGVALMGGGDLAGAVAQFRAACTRAPRFALAHNNLGNALRLQGDTEGAISCFRQALASEPRLVAAHTNLGQLLCEGNQLTEALAHCQEAVQLQPNHPEALSNLGNALRALGRLDEAKARYTEALRLSPPIGMLYNNMAQALQEEGKFGEATAWYQQALQRDPNAARIHANLASCFSEQDRYEDGVARYRIALSLDPGFAEAHNGLGWVRQEQGRYDEALKCYREAVRLKPTFAAAHNNLGALLEELNDLPQAEKSLREALRLDARPAGTYGHLATLLRNKLPDDDLAAMRRLLANPDLLPKEQVPLHFGLAQALDARGEYAEAAEHLRLANALTLDLCRRRGRGYEPAGHAQFVAAMMAVCTPTFFQRLRGAGLESERPVFVVGLPRSGTTLVEQILASHSQVFGAGELSLAREDFQSLPGLRASDEAAMDSLARLDIDTVRLVGQRHLERLYDLHATAVRVVDKMPDNYLYLGMLAVLFPRAKFIHCRRDLRDVAVSCWMTNFRSIRWANDPEHVAARFRDYQRLTEHWRAVLPVPVLEVAYEDTVADLEGVARRLVAWCGLEWEPACLAFHESKRPVRTASVTQVRQPVYTRSVARWKNYEAVLGPLFARLGMPPEAETRT